MNKSWEIKIEDKSDPIIVLADDCLIDPHPSVWGVSWRTHDGVAFMYPWNRVHYVKEFFGE